MRRLLIECLSFAQRVGRAIIRALARLENLLRDGSTANQAAAVIRSTRYNMSSGGNEAYYLRQYLHWLLKEFQHKTSSGPMRVLDLGCGQGRMLKPLLLQFPEAQFTAVDISSAALAGAKDHLGAELCQRVDFRNEDIGAFLTATSTGSFDLILMNEVTFFYPGWQRLLPNMVRLLRPGGILAMSFRSQYFYGLLLTQARAFDEYSRLLSSGEAALRFCGNSPLTFTWQRSSEIRTLAQEQNLELKHLVAIGAGSGIPGDPHAKIVEPSALTSAEQEELLAFELAIAPEVPDAGRYMLGIFRKVAV